MWKGMTSQRVALPQHEGVDHEVAEGEAEGEAGGEGPARAVGGDGHGCCGGGSVRGIRDGLVGEVGRWLGR